jgi:hypothetical protein
MQRFFSMPAERQAMAFAQAGATSGWNAGSVEKDFWVCVVLREVFALPRHGPNITFKGGTSLSKAWQLIDRFSEDVDLTIDRAGLGFGGDKAPEAAATGKEQKRRLKSMTTACQNAIRQKIAPALRQRLATFLPNSKPWSLEVDADDPDGQTLLFAYPVTQPSSIASYLRPVVKLEFGSRSDPWPTESRRIAPIVAERLPALFDAPGSMVRALRPERTFWEKAMLLHEERFRPAGKSRRAVWLATTTTFGD